MTTSTLTPTHDCAIHGHSEHCPAHPGHQRRKELEISAHELADRDVIEVAIGTHRTHLTLGEAHRLHSQLGHIVAADGTVEPELPTTEVQNEAL